jgi:hypothetical protein
MYHPPAHMPKGSPPQPPPPAPLSIPPMTSSPPRTSSDSVTHPPSPFTRARGRGSGSPQAPRSSTEQPPTSNVPPSPRAPAIPSSPVQKAAPPPPNIAVGLPSSPTPSFGSVNNTPFRTPPEVPPSPTLAQRTLPQPPSVLHSPMKTPPHPRAGSGMISVAAFRRPTPRTSTEPQPAEGSRDVSPLSIRKKDLRNAPRMSGGTSNPLPPLPGVRPPEPVASSPQELHQEDEFDYIAAYYNSGGDEESRPRSGVLR